MLSRLYYIEYKQYIDSKEDIIMLVDEGELYLHPNIQSKFLDNLMNFFQYIFRKNKVHLILTSNSPFIISDLPNSNIIYIASEDREGQLKENIRDNRTFGANIHSLLSDSFFMEDGTIGMFAKKKINNVINLLNLDNKSFFDKLIEKDIKLNEIENIIEMIGEDIIRKKMYDLYREKLKFINDENTIGAESTKKLLDEFLKLSNKDKNQFLRELVLISKKGDN